MFSKEESRQMRHHFWVSFGKSFPRKWILYKTKIKDFGFKFHFDTKKAMVMLDVESENASIRRHYYEKVRALEELFRAIVPEIEFYDSLYLENNKEISRVAVTLEGVSIHNRDTWASVMIFLNETMIKFELFWQEYEEIIRMDPLSEEETS